MSQAELLGEILGELRLMREQQQRPPKLAYSVEECCDALGVCTETLMEAVRRQEIRVVRLGRRILIPRSWLEQALEELATGGSCLPAKRAG
jgi:excisionase family DNA binding protein